MSRRRRREAAVPEPDRSEREQPEPDQRGHDRPAAVFEIDDDTFDIETAKGFTFVDFWAPWCAPCRTFAPFYVRIAEQHGDSQLRFASCNVDRNRASAELLQVHTIPTVVLFDPQGSEVARLVGFIRPKVLEDLVEQVHDVLHRSRR